MIKFLKRYFIIIIILILAGYSYFIEPNMLEVNRYKVNSPDLKSVKIVFAADFHVKPYGQKRINMIIDKINAENPDLVLSSGDYVCGHTKHSTMPIEKIAKNLSRVKTKFGFFTSLGNHDGWYGPEVVTKNLEENGIKVLSNSNIELNINGQKLFIAGIEDYDTGKPDVEKATRGTDGYPVILLTHQPDMFLRVSNDVTLTLAGHTHGGQVRIPLIGPIFTASNHHDKYTKGWKQLKNKELIPVDVKKTIQLSKDTKTMFVTRGIGVSILPFRFNSVPEIDVIEFE